MIQPGVEEIAAPGEGAPELSEEELAALEAEKKQKREEALIRLNALGESLAKTRAEAIAARKASGVEDEWLEDEEFYQGIDDANREEQKSSAFRSRPPGQAMLDKPSGTRSTVFPNITGPYVDASAARIADMLLPTDDRAWALKPTPVPELVDLAKGKLPQSMLREAVAMFPGQPQLAKNKLAAAVEEAARVIAEAKDKADKAQTRIEDWHVECQFHSHVRLVIEDAARIGTGVLKGPIPVKKRAIAYKDGALVINEEIKPGSKWIDPWNFYPDPACGENIHNGSYTWEEDYLTRKQLRELQGQENYVEESIAACLEEGPLKITGEYKQSPDPQTDKLLKDKFQVWYFHGTAEKVDLEAAGCDCEGEEDPHLPAMIAMVNNRVIKAALNPLDTGDFPYDVMIWRRKAGSWTGTGVARQVRTPQRIVTAATRNLMDNAGIAAGPMLVFIQGVVVPVNGVAEVAARKMWYIAEGAEGIADVSKAIGTIKVDMLVVELTKIIELGLSFAEHVTGLPLLLQGQMGKAPDTLGGMQMLSNNASTTLRRLARFFDDRITEPHVRRYYVYLLLYGEDEEKGDFAIDARGSSALVERNLQNQAIAQMGNLILDPRFGKDPKKWMDEFLKSQRLDAKRFDYDDEDWQKIVENMKQGPQDQRLAVEQLRSQTLERLKQLDQAFEAQENDKDRQVKLLVEQLDERVQAMKLAGAKEISFDDLKAMLAKTAMQLSTQRELSSASIGHQKDIALAGHKVDLKKHLSPVAAPPTEPAGRAKPGQAFQA